MELLSEVKYEGHDLDIILVDAKIEGIADCDPVIIGYRALHVVVAGQFLPVPNCVLDAIFKRFERELLQAACAMLWKMVCPETKATIENKLFEIATGVE